MEMPKVNVAIIANKMLIILYGIKNFQETSLFVI